MNYQKKCVTGFTSQYFHNKIVSLTDYHHKVRILCVLLMSINQPSTLLQDVIWVEED